MKKQMALFGIVIFIIFNAQSKDFPDFFNKDLYVLKYWDICVPGNVDSKTRGFESPLFGSRNDYTLILKQCPRELSTWGEEVSEATKKLFLFAKENDFEKFKSCFLKDTPKNKILELFRLFYSQMLVWTLDIPAVARSKDNPEVFFSCAVSYGSDYDDKISAIMGHGRSIDEFDWIEQKDQRQEWLMELYEGFCCFIYWKMQDGKLLVDSNYNFDPLKKLIGREIVSEYHKYTVRTKETKSFKKDAEKAIDIYDNYISNKERKREVFNETKRLAYGDLEKELCREDAMVELKKIHQQVLKNDEYFNGVYRDMTPVETFKHAALNADLKILRKPIIFCDAPFIPTDKPKTLLDQIRWKLCGFFHRKLDKTGYSLESDIIKFNVNYLRNFNTYELFAYSLFKLNGKKYISLIITGFNKQDPFYNFVHIDHGIQRKKWVLTGNDNEFSKTNGVDVALAKYSISGRLTWEGLFGNLTLSAITGKEYNEALNNAGLFSILRIKSPEECDKYKPGMKLLELPVMSAKEINIKLKDTIKSPEKPNYTPTQEQIANRKKLQKLYLNPPKEFIEDRKQFIVDGLKKAGKLKSINNNK